MSRREITRAAIFGVGAVVLSACGSSAEGSDTTPPDQANQNLSSGDEAGADEGGDMAHGRGDGEDDATHTADEHDEAEDTEDVRLRDGDQVLIGPEEPDGWRRRRRMPRCVSEGTCAAPPYGAPPAEMIV